MSMYPAPDPMDTGCPGYGPRKCGVDVPSTGGVPWVVGCSGASVAEQGCGVTLLVPCRLWVVVDPAPSLGPRIGVPFVTSLGCDSRTY